MKNNISPKLDKYNRNLEPGKLVVGATGWSRGPRFGIVKRLCRLRIRVEYRYQWVDRQGDRHWHATDILQQPSRLIIVDESLPSTLTMQLCSCLNRDKLEWKIPLN